MPVHTLHVRCERDGIETGVTCLVVRSMKRLTAVPYNWNARVRAAQPRGAGPFRRPGPGLVTLGHVTTEPHFAAVLFDMDGTLVDSEKIWQIGLEELAAHIGVDLEPSVRAAMVGTTTPEAMAILYAANGLTSRDAGEDGQWLEDRVLVLFAEGASWRPGARELLEAVRAAGLRTALVTATARPLVEVMLDTLGRHNFDAIVTDDDVLNGKPDPEPYASAAAAVGVDPRDCVAIEDSPNGILSALAAGCTVVAVPAEVDLDHIGGVTHVRSLADVDVAFLRAAVEGAPVAER
jgi:HAD superfamily hydrolase (TIGR01509 family)